MLISPSTHYIFQALVGEQARAKKEMAALQGVRVPWTSLNAQR
jgi:hypothetical protein